MIGAASPKCLDLRVLRRDHVDSGPRYLVGTRRFNSSNQLSTTWICGA